MAGEKICTALGGRRTKHGRSKINKSASVRLFACKSRGKEGSTVDVRTGLDLPTGMYKIKELAGRIGIICSD